ELEGGKGMYQAIDTFEVKVRYEEEGMKRAVKEVTKRHEMLRTGIEYTEYSEPLQLVYEEARIPIEVIDLREERRERQAEEIEEKIRKERVRRFEIRKAPLIRLVIHVLEEERIQVTMSFHHAILDGWSMATLMEEVFDKYVREMRGEEREKEEELRSKYRDYVAAEKETMRSEEARRYWAEKVGGVVVTRIGEEGDGGGRGVGTKEYVVEEEIGEGMREMGRRLGVPLKSVMLAAHMRVMGMMSGEEEVVTGVVTHGRMEEEDGERVVGLFLNTLPVRLR